MFQGALLFAVSLFLAQAEKTLPARFSFEWSTNGAHRVSVCGTNMGGLVLQKDWRKLLQVSVEPEDVRSAIGLPAISGEYLLDERCVYFKPQFPFQPGVRYRATFTPPGQKPISSVFQIPLVKREPTTVVSQIYPSADVLPENLLKFYLYFSAPMSGGHIYEQIHLTNEKGDAVELPFLEIDEELWNADMTRLTLFLDPGRIKRGVKPLEEIGPALEEGKRYTLTIAREWLDGSCPDEDDAELQRRLHEEAEKWIGSINSGDPYGSERVKERVHAKIIAKHRRLQRHAPSRSD